MDDRAQYAILGGDELDIRKPLVWGTDDRAGLLVSHPGPGRARAEAALAAFPRRALVDRYPHTLGILVGLVVGGASAARMAGWL